MPGPGGRLRGAGMRAHRVGQDGGGRVRCAPGARGRAEVLLHHTDQGAVEPEVQRPRRTPRPEVGRPAHRGQLDQRRCTDRGDDHGGAAQHALRRQRIAGRPGLRRDGRGALPRRPVPWRGLGGGDHPSARRGATRQPVRDRLQRRGVRRMAGLGSRRDEGDRARTAAGPVVAAHARRLAVVRPVRGRREHRRAGLEQARQRATAVLRARRPADTADVRRAATGRRTVPTCSPAWTARACCR